MYKYVLSRSRCIYLPSQAGLLIVHKTMFDACRPGPLHHRARWMSFLVPPPLASFVMILLCCAFVSFSCTFNVYMAQAFLDLPFLRVLGNFWEAGLERCTLKWHLVIRCSCSGYSDHCMQGWRAMADQLRLEHFLLLEVGLKNTGWYLYKPLHHQDLVNSYLLANPDRLPQIRRQKDPARSLSTSVYVHVQINLHAGQRIALCSGWCFCSLG